MKIYLDIDGTIITKQGQPAPFLFEFLEYVTKEHACYWLTTHCRDGNADVPCRYLSQRIDDRAGWIYRIKPTKWDVLKTDALDFSQDFLWFDDYIMDAEMKVLEEHDAVQKFVKIDLDKNPTQLKEHMAVLEKSFGVPVWKS